MSDSQLAGLTAGQLVGGPISWYQNFFSNRVLPKVCKDMETVGSDFYPWIEEQAPELYIRINRAWEEVDSLWLSQAEKDSFKAACKTWYELLLEAKKGYEEWKRKQLQELQLAGQQESLMMR